MTAEKLNVLIKNYFTVIQELDQIKILSVDLIPKTFNEYLPSKIVSSFFDYLDSEEAKSVETESINGRYEANYYDSIYKIYHDLTVITLILLSKFKAGDLSYIKIDNFYKFSIQLLLFESARLQLTFTENTEDKPHAPLTELESKISNDYALITTAYVESNSEALFVMGNKNTPLFSSLLKSSSLDERDLGVEHPFIRTTILPQFEQQQIAANTIGNLSPLLPSQNTSSEQISNELFHPNWFGLTVSNWLKPTLQSPVFSFLPSVDGSKTIVSNELKGLTWLQQVGFKELQKLRNSDLSEGNAEVTQNEDVEMTSVDEVPKSVEESKDEVPKLIEESKDKAPKSIEESKVESVKENSIAESKDETLKVGYIEGSKDETAKEPNEESPRDTLTESSGEKNDSIQLGNEELDSTETNGKLGEPAREPKILDLKNMLEFNPAVDEEEMISSILTDLPSSSKLIQSKINKHLLQLNKLSKIPVRHLELEKKLYLKIERLLRYLILLNDITPNKLQLPISFKVPVTQNNYAGSLPGPLLGSMSTSQGSFGANGSNVRPGVNGYKSNRLSSINKKYKK